MGDLEEITVVVPCYNEAGRLDREELARLARMEGVRILFVDDGSTDSTERILQEISSASDGKASVRSLSENSGKAEAVRQGLLEALDGGAPLVGYLDADLATPVGEYCRLVDEARRSRAQIVMGARVAMSGRRIERRQWRHFLGRIFATMASIVLRAGIYDTQCGAKIFRSSQALRSALGKPFISRWVFDVELLGRLIGDGGLGEGAIIEVPLRRWTDVDGSKLGPLDMARVAAELARIAVSLKR